MKSSRKTKFDWRGPALAAFSLILTLAACELAGRLLLHHNWTQPRDGRGIYTLSDFPEKFRVMTPHWNGMHVRHNVAVNSKSLRHPEVSYLKPPGQLRILALGDSFTFGYGVGYEETYPLLLEKLIKKNLAALGIESCSVINAGVDGDSIFDETAYYERIGRLFSPDIVIQYHVENDILPNDDPRVLRVEKWYDIRNPIHNFLAPRSYLYNYFIKRRQFRFYSENRQDNYMRLLRDAYKEGSPYWKNYAAAFDKLKDMVEKDGGTLIVASYTHAGKRDDWFDLVKKNALEKKVGFVKLFHDMKSDPSLWVEPYWPHPSGKLNGIVAQKLYDYMQKEGYLGRRPTPGRKSLTWNFADASAVEQWSSHSPGVRLKPVEGALAFESVDKDPFLLDEHINITKGRIGALEIRMKISPDASEFGQFFWSPGEGWNFSEHDSIRFKLVRDGLWQDYTLQSPLFAGEDPETIIGGLRIDPADEGGSGAIQSITLVFND